MTLPRRPARPSDAEIRASVEAWNRHHPHAARLMEIAFRPVDRFLDWQQARRRCLCCDPQRVFGMPGSVEGLKEYQRLPGWLQSLHRCAYCGDVLLETREGWPYPLYGRRGWVATGIAPDVEAAARVWNERGTLAGWVPERAGWSAQVVPPVGMRGEDR